ncbi:MAG TPA: polysaccharide deacetylase family protein [Vicinamibacteria bacterium]|nr:polysaccharide deacetylase family protein [Vicinamibacteria bacterium]
MLALLASTVIAQDFPTLSGTHPVLVSVDDLPIGSGSLHPDPVERERITRGLLDVMAKHQIKAAGMVTWKNVGGPAGEKLLQMWLDAGHELGNHTYEHLDYSRTDANVYIADLEKGRMALQGFLDKRGGTVRLFRFPFLREGETIEKLRTVRSYLEATGQRTLPVTIDNQDWSFEQPWVEARKAGDRDRLARLGEDYQHALRLEVLTQTALGDLWIGRATPQILLLHANEVGTAQWDELFTWMKARGFRFAAADEVLADVALQTPHEFVGRYGGGLWQRLRHERRREQARGSVESLLRDQAAAWTRGDLDAFVSHYAPDARFVAADGVTVGRDAVLARYRKRYAGKEAMGTLTLEPLNVRDIWGPEVSALGDAEASNVHSVSVVARWTLERTGQPKATGLTLLVFRRDGGKWWVVEDASL